MTIILVVLGVILQFIVVIASMLVEQTKHPGEAEGLLMLIWSISVIGAPVCFYLAG